MANDRKLGPLGRAVLVVLALGALGLVGATLAIVRTKRLEAERQRAVLEAVAAKRRRDTEEKAQKARELLGDLSSYLGTKQARAWSPRGTVCAVAFAQCDGGGIWYAVPMTATSKSDERCPKDPWGNPYRFSSPGPVHRNGWDVWSAGPNGIDELGAGDDLLVGEDVAPVKTFY